MKKKSQRVSSERLQEIAFENPGSQIELDADYGLAFLVVGDTEYISTYDEATAS